MAADNRLNDADGEIASLKEQYANELTVAREKILALETSAAASRNEISARTEQVSAAEAQISELTAALDACNWEGAERPAVLAGTIGPDARAIGGALLPLYANFAPDRDLFLKLAP